MSNVYPFLPKLTIHRQFIDDFVAASVPCFALGMIAERKQPVGVFALQLGVINPPEFLTSGFNFGYSLLGDGHCEVLHFAFEFTGVGTYNVLVNPHNPLVQRVLAAIISHGETYVLAIGTDQRMTVFRSEIGEENLAGLRGNQARLQRSITSDTNYQQTLGQFQKRPFPPGQLLTWVCRDNLEYLDIATNPLALTPALLRSGVKPATASNLRVAQRQALAELLDNKVNKLLEAGVADDVVLMAHMAPEMPLFKQLLDSSDERGMYDLCAAYPGLYRFAKLLEFIAAGIQSGKIKVQR